MEKYIHIKKSKKEFHITRVLEREREIQMDLMRTNHPSRKACLALEAHTPQYNVRAQRSHWLQLGGSHHTKSNLHNLLTCHYHTVTMKDISVFVVAKILTQDSSNPAYMGITHTHKPTKKPTSFFI